MTTTNLRITFQGHDLLDVVTQMRVFLTNAGMGENDAPLTRVPDSAMEDEPARPTAGEEVKELRPRKTKPKPETIAAPDTAPEEETVPGHEGDQPAPDEPKTEDVADLRKSAISKLMGLYNRGGDAQVQVKGLLKDFDVKKFSDVKDERIPALLDNANTLWEKFPE